MKTIAFSHHYPKIHGQVQAKLIAVIPLSGREISEPLLEYDTTFVEDGVAGRFPLKKSGNYIQLIFIGDFRIPFCTIRPAWPPEKVKYYTSAIGEVFSIRYATKGGAK